MLKKILLLSLCLFVVSCATLEPMNDDDNEVQMLQNEKNAYNTGMHYLIGRGVPQNYATAASWFEKAAANGNPYAESQLAYLYMAGKGVRQDYTTAMMWYQKAADHGLASAQYSLGLMYLHGIGTPVDKVTARKLFQDAAARGFGPARRALTNG